MKSSQPPLLPLSGPCWLFFESKTSLHDMSSYPLLLVMAASACLLLLLLHPHSHGRTVGGVSHGEGPGAEGWLGRSTGNRRAHIPSLPASSLLP